jgi:hypothetical protein
MAVIDDNILDTIDLINDDENSAILEALKMIRNDSDYCDEYFSMGVKNSKPREAYLKACDKVIELFTNPYVYRSK